jgi:hypothetical protein
MKVCCCCKSNLTWTMVLYCTECPKITRFRLCKICYEKLMGAGMDLIAYCSEECSKKDATPIHKYGLLALYHSPLFNTYDLVAAMDVLYAL